MFIKTLAIALLYTLLVPFSLAQNNSVDSQEIATEKTHEHHSMKRHRIITTSLACTA